GQDRGPPLGEHQPEEVVEKRREPVPEELPQAAEALLQRHPFIGQSPDQGGLLLEDLPHQLRPGHDRFQEAPLRGQLGQGLGVPPGQLAPPHEPFTDPVFSRNSSTRRRWSSSLRERPTTWLAAATAKLAISWRMAATASSRSRAISSLARWRVCSASA